MSDTIKEHCIGPVSWDHYIGHVHVHRIYEWERLRALEREKKDGTEEEKMELMLDAQYCLSCLDQNTKVNKIYNIEHQLTNKTSIYNYTKLPI